MQSIYLDHAATTPIDPSVNDVMYEHSKKIYGNPSSVHSFGREARKYVDEARKTIATSLHAHETEIMFTSGGTEAINSAMIGVALANKDKGKHLITTDQEHQATLNTMHYLESIGFEVTYVQVSPSGRISVDDVRAAMTDQTILTSIMMVNNETGIIQPVEEIGSLCTEKQVLFHTDAVQAFGPLELNVETLAVDLLTISAHKINGPKGIGALYIRKGTHMEPILFGGEQERKGRPGTENIIGMVGFKQAVQKLVEHRTHHQEQIRKCKQAFLHHLKDQGVLFEINGDQTNCIPGIVNISFTHTHVEALLMNLDIEGIAASSGSACTAGTVEPSHVLEAMYGTESDRVTNSIRFSFGTNNSPDEMEEAAKRIATIVRRISNKGGKER